jgi:hypothetical protein
VETSKANTSRGPRNRAKDIPTSGLKWVVGISNRNRYELLSYEEIDPVNEIVSTFPNSDNPNIRSPRKEINPKFI